MTNRPTPSPHPGASIAHTPAAEIKYVSGSVEAACGLGLADAVVDLVETGTTMKVERRERERETDRRDTFYLFFLQQ